MLNLGNCYKIHADTIIEKHDKDYLLCHGTVYHPLSGWHGHCWLEKGCFCIDIANGNDVTLPKDFYYKLGCIKDVSYYTPDEVIEKLFETGNYGPW